LRRQLRQESPNDCQETVGLHLSWHVESVLRSDQVSDPRKAESHMRALFPHSSETEKTAWLLIVVLLGLVLVFCFLFQQRISRDLPQSIHPAAPAFGLASK
jgi:hypothetical protein